MYDMIIVGAGPAGISAVVYGKSRGKKVSYLKSLCLLLLVMMIDFKYIQIYNTGYHKLTYIIYN